MKSNLQKSHARKRPKEPAASGRSRPTPPSRITLREFLPILAGVIILTGAPSFFRETGFLSGGIVVVAGLSLIGLGMYLQGRPSPRKPRKPG